MSNKKKTAGIDRPYTPVDLGEIIYGYIKDGDWANKARLDYFIPEAYNNMEITSEEFDTFTITDFGSNEGIYTDFFIEFRGKERISLLTAKTLGTSEENYVKMHEMAAHVCYKFNDFISRNLDNFIWSGYDVSYVDRAGIEHAYCWSGSMERVAENANHLRNDRDAVKVFYMDKSTRKKKEYKF